MFFFDIIKGEKLSVICIELFEKRILLKILPWSSYFDPNILNVIPDTWYGDQLIRIMVRKMTENVEDLTINVEKLKLCPRYLNNFRDFLLLSLKFCNSLNDPNYYKKYHNIWHILELENGKVDIEILCKEKNRCNCQYYFVGFFKNDIELLLSLITQKPLDETKQEFEKYIKFIEKEEKFIVEFGKLELFSLFVEIYNSDPFLIRENVSILVRYSF